MSGMPKDALTWATNDTHSDAGRPWHGQPTKVDPGAGVRATGHLPDRDAPAEWENFLKNAAGRWAEYFRHVQLKNWTHTDPGVLTGKILRVVYNQELRLYVAVADAAASGIASSPDTLVWTDRSGGLGGGDLLKDVAVRNEDLPSAGLARFLACGLSTIAYESDNGTAWTARPNNPAATGTANWWGAAYVNSANAVDANGTFLIVGGDGTNGNAYIYSTADGGNTWTQRLSVNPTGAPDEFLAVAATADGSEVVAVGEGDLSYTSTDGGATWAADTHTGGNIPWIAITYDEDSETFYAIGTGATDSSVAKKAKGDTVWTAIASSAVGGDFYFGIAAYGHAIVIGAESGLLISTAIDDDPPTYWPAPSALQTYGPVSLANGAFFVGSRTAGDADEFVRSLHL